MVFLALSSRLRALAVDVGLFIRTIPCWRRFSAKTPRSAKQKADLGFSLRFLCVFAPRRWT